MLPAAPATFSTTTGTFHVLLNRSPKARASTSVVPPAACGTTKRTVLEGYCSARAAAPWPIVPAQRTSAETVTLYAIIRLSSLNVPADLLGAAFAPPQAPATSLGHRLNPFYVGRNFFSALGNPAR